MDNRGQHELVRRLDRWGVGDTNASSYVTSELKSVISPQVAGTMGSERSDLAWEEIELLFGKEANMTANAILVMVASGAVAAVGIATNAVHVVVGAMVIAPGFVPIQRIALGITARSGAWRRGLAHTGIAYAALILGAATTAVACDQDGAGDGVMIALALVPTAALMGVAIVSGAPMVLRDATLRWMLDVALVFGAGLLVFLWKRKAVHGRDARF